MSILQLLLAYPAATAGYRYWRLRVDSPASATSISEWQITETTAAITSLVGKTVTALSGEFTAPYNLSKINDGTAETVNGTNMAYSGTQQFDVYVDLGAPYSVNAYLLAPQGGAGAAYNTPIDFTVLASNDAASWTTVTSFTGISTGGWTAGSFRTFSW